MQLENYRFALEDSRWTSFLDEHGFVVVRRVVADAPAFVAAYWDLLEALSGGRLDRRNSATLKLGRNWPAMLHGGMIQYIGHGAAQWALRERCAPVFATLWGVGVDALATSFDGLCFMSGQRAYRPRSPIGFVHTDQAPHRPPKWSIQGLVNLIDNDESAGGLVVIPGTHKIHAEYFKKIGRQRGSDWYLFSDQEKKDPLFRRHLKVCGEAGDVMLFDSRTFHCNTTPTRPVDRACAYVCMLPKRQVPKAVVPKRAEALAERRCTSHHPGEGFRVFPRLPRHLTAEQREAYEAKLPGLQPGPENALQRSLAHAA